MISPLSTGISSYYLICNRMDATVRKMIRNEISSMIFFFALINEKGKEITAHL